MVSEVVKMIVSYYIIHANHFDRPGMKVTILKIKIFSIATSICPEYCYTQLSCAKKIVEKFSFNELKIEKVRFFTGSPTKTFCISVFNVGSCLVSCLTIRPFLTLDT